MGDTAVTDSYRVLLSGGEGEIVEKKSRFIATIRKCETEEAAVTTATISASAPVPPI